MANSIATIEIKDIPSAVLKAKDHEKCSRVLRMMVSINIEVHKPAIIASII